MGSGGGLMADRGGYQWRLPEVGDAFNHILDTFGGANSEFVALLFLVRELDSRAANGDEAAAELLKVITRMSRFITVAQGSLKQE